MLHLAHQRALQTDEIAGHHEIQDLPAPVLQHLVAKAPAVEHGVEMRAAGALGENGRAGLDRQFAHLEGRDEIHFRLGEGPEMIQRAQGTELAGRAPGGAPHPAVGIRLTATSSLRSARAIAIAWPLRRLSIA